MADLSDFKRIQIVGAGMVGASVTKTAQMLGVSRGTVLKVMIAFEKEKKTPSAKHKSGRKSKFSEKIMTQSIQLELLKIGIRNIVIKLSIFYGQHNLQTSILLVIDRQF